MGKHSPAERRRDHRSLTKQPLFFVSIVGLSCLVGLYLAFLHGRHPVLHDSAEAAEPALSLQDIPFDGSRAYSYLSKLCELGPRFSGSPGMAKQQALLEKHFTQQGAEVARQSTAIRHPHSGKPVEISNLVITWHPDRTDRILLCAHYDTRPWPDLDPVNPRGEFLGANDGASGVAVLMEMGEWMSTLDGPIGVDFALFDAEEFVWENDGKYCLGSTWFAQQYVRHPPDHRYRAAVLLDMIADSDLRIVPDRLSMQWRDTRPLVEEIWSVAKRLGVKQFTRGRSPDVFDDHVPLHNIAGIPACDLIDFGYPAWHTTRDLPDQCSADSLARVGWVVLEWLKEKNRQGIARSTANGKE